MDHNILRFRILVLKTVKGEKLITKKCKESYACKLQQRQNDKAAWYGKQCNPDFWINSHCRCCCDGDLCNDGELPCLSKSKHIYDTYHATKNTVVI